MVDQMGSNVQAWLKSHQAQFAEEFRQCGRLAEECQEYLVSFTINSRNSKQVVLLTLFVRLLQLYEGAIWLAQWGMGPGSRTVLRAELETAFILGAIAKDDSTLARYINQDDLQRLKLINTIERTNSSLLAKLDKGRAQEIKTELRQRVDREGTKHINIEDYARMAGLQEWYDTAYRLLSSAVHTSVRDIERTHLTTAEEEIKEIHARPSLQDTYLVITTGSNLVLMSAETLTAAIEQGNLTKLMELKPYFLELSRPATKG